ncbi:heteropolysaccharide repeat-containing protein [Carnobacterium sp. 17-4]|uniref:oligosaccharide flippase family protein n=1 Tax=Carnobacterium sp. (strain 17-4) TaxID=208596 RepID=UPI0002058DE7|nr:oligosaccharide flippase family protein [Carnobacterium sp. 17-4]AEB30201.1 heteropolysaccharide repeat-containing protein [Carnobacterium sp. 17-4]
MQSKKFLSLLKNMSYTISSNLISLLISTFVVLIIPKLIGVEEYGYWQIYLFYGSYIVLLHLGWNDGIYLRYGGENYKKLDKRKFYSQFWSFFIFQFIVSLILLLVIHKYMETPNDIFIFTMLSIFLLIVNVRSFLHNILQATNLIKTYSISTILDRLVYVILISILLLTGNRDFKLLIIADLVGKSVSLLYAMYLCRDIVFGKFEDFYFDLIETVENIRVGISLMFANIASSLILGIVRFGIERVWSVAIFGKISLTLSVSNLLMVFVNATSLVIYPMLRRTNTEKLKDLYSLMRTLLIVPLIGVLIMYYPLKYVLSLWLPEYAESLNYMALIFPMILFESKTALLINTYLKTIRKERIILKVNIYTVCVSIIITMISTLILENLTVAMLSIGVLLAFRSIVAELLLSKIIKVNVVSDIYLEIFMSIIFIITSWYIKSIIGIFIYILFYFIYLLIKRKEIMYTYNFIKKLLKV